MANQVDQLVVLCAADPEMQAIEGLLQQVGIRYAYALGPDGRRVHPGNAYQASGYRFPGEPEGVSHHGPDWERVTHVVEGETIDVEYRPDWVVFDHHRPGDPGYGRPPAEFVPASSLGQVIAWLARLGRLPDEWSGTHDGQHPAMCGTFDRTRFDWCVASGANQHGETYWYHIPWDLVLAAAADHCLGAAYRGECPCVDPDALMRWRAESRAAFQGRSVDEVLADVERARQVLREAPGMALWCPACEGTGLAQTKYGYAPEEACAACTWDGDGPLIPQSETMWARDLRGQYIPELPEASAREGICFIADGLPGPDGRIKVVCQSGSPEQIRAFLEHWAPAQGLVDLYGDPARGLAGGHLQGEA